MRESARRLMRLIRRTLRPLVRRVRPRRAVPPVRFEVRPSIVHAGGVGLFAVRNLPDGSFICHGPAVDFFSQVTPWSAFEALDEDVKTKIRAFGVGTETGFLGPVGLDFNTLTIEDFLNHACDGNCGFDDRGDIVATRSIAIGEELTYDYSLLETDPNFAFDCACGGASCRGRVSGSDWRNDAYYDRTHERMHPQLRRR